MSEFTSVKDSGRREEFTTGSRRDTREGKGRFDLMSVLSIVRDARHLENGAKKYGDRNWEKGQPLSRYIDSSLRHLVKMMLGLEDEDHPSALRWNISGYSHTKAMIKAGVLPKELDDMPSYPPEFVKYVLSLMTPVDEPEDGKLPKGVFAYRGFYIVPATVDPNVNPFMVLNAPSEEEATHWLRSDGKSWFEYGSGGGQKDGTGNFDTRAEAELAIDEAIAKVVQSS